jgi:hypothetical protein
MKLIRMFIFEAAACFVRVFSAYRCNFLNFYSTKRKGLKYKLVLLNLNFFSFRVELLKPVFGFMSLMRIAGGMCTK